MNVDGSVSTSSAASAKGSMVFVHGYLDGPEAWDRVLHKLALPSWRFNAIRLQPVNDPSAPSEKLLQQYAQQVLSLLSKQTTANVGSVVLVGHSMGGQIVELAARQLGDALAGVVLITPAPLGGYPLPAEVMERFASRAGMTDIAQIKQGKRNLAVALDDEALDLLARSTAAMDRDAALEQLRAWTGGHPAGMQPSQIEAPVLIVTSDDTFFTAEMLEQGARRFPSFSIQRIEGAGHWPHLEQPDALAAAISQFVQTLPHTKR